jgi:hypothetical protein
LVCNSAGDNFIGFGGEGGGDKTVEGEGSGLIGIYLARSESEVEDEE